MTLLFICQGNAIQSPMAEGFARAMAAGKLEVQSAGTRPVARIHPLAIKVMNEAGITLEVGKPKPLQNIDLSNVSVSITLCDGAAAECGLLLPGQPPQIHWKLAEPPDSDEDEAAQLEAFRRLRDEIRHLVADLFDRGYLEALIDAQDKARLILDSLMEGIIVHDLDRRIAYFNKAAETITGHKAQDVVGRDCHDVFPQHFCSGECNFCNQGILPAFENKTYAVKFHTPSGDERELEMSVHTVEDRDGNVAGILASFRDLTREHSLARRLGEIEQFNGIIGRDNKLQEIFELVRSVADSNVPVLVQGESGTGKELVAAAIHNESLRAAKLFVPINCGALPEGLLESELFGHVRGAFTGAVRDKKGRFELAHGGTIFLDEIGDISPTMQVKLLRVLQEGTFERVGSNHTLKTDARVISATNKDLKAEIEAGRFREDLYYRLCVVPITLPPLRDRRGDISLLANHFIKRILSESGREDLSLSPAALNALLTYDWPGNVRELQNVLQFSLVKCRGTVLELSHLPTNIVLSVTEQAALLQPIPKPGRGRKVKLNRQAVEQAISQSRGNKAEAARLLGVGRATLYRFLNDLPKS